MDVTYYYVICITVNRV